MNRILPLLIPVVEQGRIITIDFVGELAIEDLLIESREICAHKVVACAKQTLMINL